MVKTAIEPALGTRPPRAPVALVVSTSPGRDESLGAALEAAGFQVETCTEPHLLATPRSAPPALVVLDDRRPREERGASQLRLRGHPSLEGVPLVVISPDGSIDSFGGAIARGASAFLRTPADLDELPDVARRLATWPAGGRSGEARRAVRRPLLIGTDVDVPGQGFTRGRIVDVSATGCRLELARAVPAGTAVGIVPRSCEDSTEIRFGGTVRWSWPAQGVYLVAVRWEGATAIVARRVFGIA